MIKRIKDWLGVFQRIANIIAMTAEQLLELLERRKQICEKKHYAPENRWYKIRKRLGMKLPEKEEIMPLELAYDILADYPIGIREYWLSSEKVREDPKIKKSFQELLFIIGKKKKEAIHRLIIG